MITSTSTKDADNVHRKTAFNLAVDNPFNNVYGDTPLSPTLQMKTLVVSEPTTIVKGYLPYRLHGSGQGADSMSNVAYIYTLYDAIRALPDGVVGELINGQLYTQPRPSGPHALVASNLGADLVNPFSRGRGGPGGWWIIDEPEVHFERDTEVLVPDIAGWRRNRMPNIPEDQRFEVVPDWICEVLSPSTASKDREVKMPTYARYGVQYAWLIDPLQHKLEVYGLEGGIWQNLAVFGDGELINAPPFQAITLEVPWM